jgi:PBSX family phage portal protein
MTKKEEPQQIITINPLDNIDRTLKTRIDEIEDPVEIAKSLFIGGGSIVQSNVVSTERGTEDGDIFHSSGALEPPYSPDVLCKVFEHSHTLRQNVDSYCVNIDGNGHRFDAVIDLENDDDAIEQVRDAIYFERLSVETDEGLSPQNAANVEWPDDDEVKERIEEMIKEARLEKAFLEAFFRFATIDESFISLRKRTRQDKEITGNAFWEVLRDEVQNQPSQFNYVPAFTIRLMPLGDVRSNPPVKVQLKIKRTLFTYDEISAPKRFRKYVQVYEKTRVYFKEFGDPRTMSAKTGKYFETVEDLKKPDGEGPDAIAATELIHFSIHSPRSPYGIPRWIGALLSVLGSRQAEEVNFMYFENKSVPPLAILVSGGRLNADSVLRVEDYIKNKIKGRENFHSVLILQAEPSGMSSLDSANSQMKIQIVPLTSAQQKDALFQTYDERAIDKIGMQFRLPRLLRGDIRDFNRGTADAALEFTEMQVFSPERDDFDWLINRKLLPELDIKFWTFASNSPTTRDPIDLATIVTDMVKASIFTPAEARELAKSIFNRDFKKIDELWTKIPPELLKAGIYPEGYSDPSMANDTPNDTPNADANGQDEQSKDSERQAKGGETGPAKRRKRKGTSGRDSKEGFANIPKSEKSLKDLAKGLLKLRSSIDEMEKEDIKKQDIAERILENAEVINIPADEFAALFDSPDAEPEDGE